MEVSSNHHQLIISSASSPKWSPQGDKIAYLSSGKDRSCQISVANADGSNQQQLTTTVSPRLWPGWPPDGNGDPQWTPDGKKIVYVSYENEKAEIFIMNADGSKQTRLTKAEYRDENPEVTPDGKYILFSSRRSDMIGGVNSGICIMTLDGKNQQVLYKTGICPVLCK
jgi:TolB protein